jgi:hypothetical protein
MDLPTINSHQTNSNGAIISKEAKFIEANTQPIPLSELQDRHIIPVFVKDNVPTISQLDFIESTCEIAEKALNTSVLRPHIRVSHPIKGRTPEARNKPAAELKMHEKTIYYERLAFLAEVPAFSQQINGQTLTLTIGGVKAYNLDNLYNYGGAIQRFKFFIGFKVTVCTNLCIWTDGFMAEAKVRTLKELREEIEHLFITFEQEQQLEMLQLLSDYQLTETQFAKLVGRARMYHHLPKKLKAKLPPLIISDSQISAITNAYYKDQHFARNPDGSITLWNLYNLLTHAVKSSYIDKFLDRNANAGTFIENITSALDQQEDSWFLS